jgi:hypothetical protein
MGGALEGELEELELALSSMFHRRLSGRGLELRVQATAAHLDEDVPRGRLRICLLQWLRNHWSEARLVLLREFLSQTQWITADHSTQ